MNKKLIIAIIVILALGIGFGIFLEAKKSKQSNKNQITETSQSQTSSELSQSTSGQNQEGQIDTSNWKTYRNEKYGFEFKYPADAEVYSDVELSLGITFNKGKNGVTMGAYEYSKGMTVNEWADKFIRDSEAAKYYNTESITYYKEERKEVGGLLTTTIFNEQPADGFEFDMGRWPQNSVEKKLLFPCNKFVCWLDSSYSKDDPYMNERYFNSIISTLKTF